MADERLEPSLSMDIEQPLSLIIDDSEPVTVSVFFGKR
jgi:hypothetical protein